MGSVVPPAVANDTVSDSDIANDTESDLDEDVIVEDVVVRVFSDFRRILGPRWHKVAKYRVVVSVRKCGGGARTSDTSNFVPSCTGRSFATN